MEMFVPESKKLYIFLSQLRDKASILLSKNLVRFKTHADLLADASQIVFSHIIRTTRILLQNY